MDTATLIYYLGSILLLIIFSGFFSGSETGLTAASRAKIHKLRLEGNENAEKVSFLHENKEKLIGTILLGNNLVNILASALATSVMIQIFGEQGVFYATFIMTIVVLVFAEVLPKTYALQNSEKVALSVAPIMIWLVRLFYPITSTVQMFIEKVLSLFGMRADLEDDLISGEEAIRGAIELHHHEGTVQKDYRDMLGSILDLEKVEVGEIMVHRKKMVTIDIASPTSSIVRQVLEGSHTRVPLWKRNPDNIVGILHVKDLLKSLQEHIGDIEELDIMQIASPPWFIPETTSVSKQLHEFRKERKHFALVVDEYGALQGLVTLEDILEEIVGEIMDEHDDEADGIQEAKDGWYYLNGTVTIRDINRNLDWKLPDEEATTIAGLIIHEAETIPDVGEIFSFYGITFEIHEKEQNQITKIRARVEEKQEE